MTPITSNDVDQMWCDKIGYAGGEHPREKLTKNGIGMKNEEKRTKFEHVVKFRACLKCGKNGVGQQHPRKM